jgi:hypothetical protein
MFGTLEWPEFKRLRGTAINNNLKLALTFIPIPKDLLIDRPNHELWIDNPSGVVRAELKRGSSTNVPGAWTIHHQSNGLCASRIEALSARGKRETFLAILVTRELLQ